MSFNFQSRLCPLVTEKYLSHVFTRLKMHRHISIIAYKHISRLQSLKYAGCLSGAPNDGFLNRLTTLFGYPEHFQTFISAFQSGAIKIFIFSIIPGERESFQITRASVCYFPENFKSDLTYNESYNFSDYPPHHILDPKLQVFFL